MRCSTCSPSQRLTTHGLSHTLYLGLGFVENKWGIRYDDDYGEEIADTADPPVVFCSPEYFRLMWKLYLARWAEDPIEVMRIYAAKAWLLLAVPTLYPGPPFGIVLLIGLLHLLAATAFGAWGRIGFPQGFVIEGGVRSLSSGFSSPRPWWRCPARSTPCRRTPSCWCCWASSSKSFVRALLRIKAAS